MPVAAFGKVTGDMHPVTLHHYSTLPNVEFNIAFDITVPRDAFPLPTEGPIQDENMRPLYELGRRIAIWGVHVFAHVQGTTGGMFLGSARFSSTTKFCWSICQVTNIDSTLPTDSEGNNQAYCMVVKSPCLGWFDVGLSRLAKEELIVTQISRLVKKKIWHAEKASLKFDVGLTPVTMLTSHMKRILTLTLVLEQLVLWPVTSRDRRDQFGWLVRDTCFSKETVHMPENEGSSFIDADREARADLPEFSDLPFANIITNIWRCNTPGELMDGLRPLPGSFKSALFIFKGPRYVGSRERYTVRFQHAQASLRMDFVKNWSDLCASITRACYLPTEDFKVVMVHMLRCYRDMYPSVTRVVTPAQASYALDTFGRQIQLFWPLQVAGRYFQRELEAHSAGVDLEKDGKSGWAKFE